MSICYPYVIPAAVAATYTGPGDIVSGAEAWYGLRGYTAAYAAPGTNPGIDVVDQATGLTVTTIPILATGALDTAAITALGYAVYVRKMYDQTGNGHHMNGTTVVASRATLPTYTTVSSKPAALFIRADGTVMNNAGATSYPATSQPFSTAYVAERAGSFTLLSGIWAADSSAVECLYSNGVDAVRITAGGFSDVWTATDSAFHAIQNRFSGATSLIYVDGSQSTTTSNPGTNGIAASGTYILGNDDAARGLDGYIREFGFWRSDISTSFSALDTNMRTYWGI